MFLFANFYGNMKRFYFWKTKYKGNRVSTVGLGSGYLLGVRETCMQGLLLPINVSDVFDQDNHYYPQLMATFQVAKPR